LVDVSVVVAVEPSDVVIVVETVETPVVVSVDTPVDVPVLVTVDRTVEVPEVDTVDIAVEVSEVVMVLDTVVLLQFDHCPSTACPATYSERGVDSHIRNDGRQKQRQR
jgi:hypothetical protein